MGKFQIWVLILLVFDVRLMQSKNVAYKEEVFFLNITSYFGVAEVEVARRLLDWAKKNTRVWWGQVRRDGSFVPYIVTNEKQHTLFAVYTYGSIEIYFQWYLGQPPFDTEEKRLEVLKKLNQIEGIHIPEDGITRRPSIRLGDLVKNDKLGQFLAIFDWMIEEIKKY